MSPQLIIALIIALCGFGSGWQIQEWRYDAKEAENVQQTLQSVKESSAADVRRIDNAYEAQKRAVAREAGLRNNADALRGAIVSLSHSEAEALRAASNSKDAAIAAATAFRELFDTELEASRVLSETCDRHISDIQTLTEAWPRAKPD